MKLKSIYEYLSDYSKEEIDSALSKLSFQEKVLLTDRYGSDLDNPISSNGFTHEKSVKFYGSLIPKIKKLLIEQKNIVQEDPASEKENSLVETELEEKVLDLIDDNKSNNNICETLNINYEQLYQLLLNLKNKGLMLSRKYYSDGSIKYKRAKSITDLKSMNFFKADRAIITDSKENNLKFLAISDLHFGNSLERLDLINRAFDYCIKNNINIILCGGDLIDGAYTRGEQVITNLYKQIEYFIKNYPSDKNILTFSVAGDHDQSVLNKASLNIIDTCNNYRHDIIIGGYNNMRIFLKNDELFLQHKQDNNFTYQNSAPIILSGHLHKYSIDAKNNILNVTIPSLSNICQKMPSCLELNLQFNKGYIETALIKQIYFGNENIILNEMMCDLPSNRLIKYESINNIESYKNQEVVSSNPVQMIKKRPSQIDKFNQRYKKI